MTQRRQILAAAIAALFVPVHTPLSAKSGSKLAVLLAKDYTSGIDVSKYWVSEKLDGVRAFWDGSALRFRSGQAIAAPAWFVAKLPPMALDGELWLARGQFDTLSGIARKRVALDAEWRGVSYQVFELPNARGTFDRRSADLKSIVTTVGWQQLQWVAQFRVESEAALQAKLIEVVKAGGEGLVLHEAASSYVTGRSASLLKLKPVSDMDATVVSHVEGKGKYAGQMGALMLRSEDGISFKLGTGFTDEQRKNPPSVGSVVSFSYRDVTPSGKPRFASFLRVRSLP